jgi:peptide/nickel transport system substrate-binding protein
LSLKEKLIFFVLVLVSFIALIFWIGYAYFSFTEPIANFGGSYKEGMVGQPLYVNPLLSQTSEADISLAQIIYSGLLRYDKNGNIANELASGYEIAEDHKSYVFHLKEGVKWHDGQELTADDVVFTINILQDPAYKSPVRQNWQGVIVEKIDQHTIKFVLENPYFGFLENLTIGILPKHIWENIAPEKFSLAEYNMRPIGSGPYQFSDYQKDSKGNVLSYNLVYFSDYFEGPAYISKISFNFYLDEESLLNAYKKKEINGISSVSPSEVKDVGFVKSTIIHEFNMPRYFAVFFNQSKSVALANDEVRQALDYATNRQEIVDSVLFGKANVLSSPFLPQMAESQGEGAGEHTFDLEKGKKILDENGWEVKDGGIREKDGNKLEFNLLTTDWPELVQTAEILAKQWEVLGAKVDVQVLTISDLQQNYIRPREYDALLFGQATSFDPDLYSFWHSSKKSDPGLNLSKFDNEEADKLLSEVREEFDREKRIEKNRQFNKILLQEVPAVFLYSRVYIYPVGNQVRGIDAVDISSSQYRFFDINKWYVKTKRIFKQNGNK